MRVEKRTKTGTGWPSESGSAANESQGPSAGALRRAELEATLRWLECREKGAVAAASRRTRSALVRRFDRLNAPVVYPWSPSMNGRHPAHRLHRAAATILRVTSHGFRSRLWLSMKSAAWPVLAVAAAFPVLARCWKHVRSRHGLGLREQWRDVVDAALNHGIFPTEYYNRRVYATAARADKSLYINEREMIALLSAADRGSPSTQVDDLDALRTVCQKAGVAVPRTVAWLARGSIDVPGNASGTILPEKDLFLRPRKWFAGALGESWRWNAKTRDWSFGQESLTAPALLKLIGLRCSTEPWVLQEAVANHPTASRFSQGGLCSYRVATGSDEDDNPVVLFASFQLPGGDFSGEHPVCVDLTAGVDIVDGRLQAAVGEFVTDGEFDNHPATSAIIAGAAAPLWSDVVALALKAHLAFPGVPFVGWEIGTGANGPIVLDASTNWGFFPHVLPAETPFASLCLMHIRHAGGGPEGENAMVAGR